MTSTTVNRNIYFVSQVDVNPFPPNTTVNAILVKIRNRRHVDGGHLVQREIIENCMKETVIDEVQQGNDLISTFTGTIEFREGTPRTHLKRTYNRGLSCAPSGYGFIFGIVMTIVTAGPFIVIMLFADGNVVQLMMVIAILLMANINYAIYHMITINIAPTISHTVAQRFHPVAYYSVVSVCSFLYYTIGVVCAGFLNKRMESRDWILVCLEVLGLWFMSLILIFPAKFDPMRPGLKKQIGRHDAEDIENAAIDFEPFNWVDYRPSSSGGSYLITLHVFDIDGNLSNFLHCAAIHIGYACCALAAILYEIFYYSDSGCQWYEIALLVSLIVGFVCIMCFAYQSNCNFPNPRFALLAELIGLYFTIYGLILLSFSVGNFVPKFEYKY